MEAEITSPERLMQMVHAFRMSRVILSANELGVFNYLNAEGSSSNGIAAAIKANPRATNRLLNALVSAGLARKKGSLFFCTEFTARFLVRSSPAYLGGLDLANQTWKTWNTMTEAVRKGSTVAMDRAINERPGEWRESFIAAMHARGGQQALETAQALDLAATGSVLDVGGGSGIFAYAMIKVNPAIRATIFDLPNIIPITERYIAGSGFAGQVATLTGNYLEDDLGSGYDLVLMSAIIHINSPEENRLLIRKGADALNPGGQLVVLDHIMNEERTEPAVGVLFALNMLVGTFHGDTYTENEIRDWMLDAGLPDSSLVETPGGTQLLVGKKPS